MTEDINTPCVSKPRTSAQARFERRTWGKRICCWILKLIPIGRGRLLGFLITIGMFVAYASSRVVRTQVRKFSPDLSENYEHGLIETQKMILLLHEIKNNYLPLEWDQLFALGDYLMGSLPMHTLLEALASDILLLCLTCWLLPIRMLRIAVHATRIIIRIGIKCSLHLQPGLQYVSQEYMALPRSAKQQIASFLTLFVIVCYLWRSRFLTRSMSRLGQWQSRVAACVRCLGPYAIVYGILYLPVRLTFSPSSCRIMIQGAMYSVAILSSSAALYLLASVRRGGRDELTLGISPRVINAVSYIAPTPRRFSRASKVLKDDEGQTAIANCVYHTLIFWVGLIVWHTISVIPLLFLEKITMEPIPIFNFWSTCGVYQHPTKRLLLSPTAVTKYCPSILRPNYKLVDIPVFIDEIVMIFLLVSLKTMDPGAAQITRQVCTKLFKKIVTAVTGFELQSSANNQTWALFDGVQGAISYVVKADRNYLRWLTLGPSLLFHLSPLIFLIGPIMIVQVVFAVVALIIPMVCGLGAETSRRYKSSNHWMIYFTLLSIYLFGLDLFGNSSQIIAWLVYALRAKLIAVCIFQFLAHNPAALGFPAADDVR